MKNLHGNYIHHMAWDCDCHTSSPEYAERFSGRAGKFMLARQCSVLKEYLGCVYGKKVLDAGGGHGQNAEPVLAGGGLYTALVSNPSCAAMLRSRLTELGFRPDKFIKFGRLDRMPFDDLSFEAAVSLRIMSHVPDWRLFLSEMCRVSRRIVIIDFAPEACFALKKILFYAKDRFEKASRDFATQSASEIAQYASSAGFRLKSVEREFILPMLLHRLTGGRLAGIEKIAEREGLTRFTGGPAVALLERKLES